MSSRRTSPLLATAALLLASWMALRFGRAFLAQCTGAFAGLGH